MGLVPGTRLGPYEIVAPLGAGGMGEVYRARDSRLGREVAVKVLPTGVADDPDRLRRFEQEAKAVSALNHPHIVTLHEIGQSEYGPYLVLEKIEGHSLRELLREGALPVKRVLALGAQIAEGLAKAHTAGIVHRDLKPENVMVSADGFAKILDFGLAKLVYPEIEGGAAHEMTTLIEKTASGMILGTLGYLSPEQAAGKPADFRSDQFALGALLYELATGERPFKRETTPESLAAVIRDDPEPMRSKSAALPAQLGWIVERCLAKDPNDRYGSTKDLARDLADLRDHLSEIARGDATASALPPRRRWRERLAWSAAAAGVALASLLAAWPLLRGKAPPTSAARSEPTFQQLTFGRGYVGAARFTPDGETVVYSAAWAGAPTEPFLTRLDQVESRAVGVPGAQVLAVSSTGELALALDWRQEDPYSGYGSLARLPLVGGVPRVLAENVQLADWAPDGKSLAVVVRQRGAQTLEYPIGKEIFSPAGQIISLRVSPKGDRLAVILQTQGGLTVNVVDLAGKATTLSRGWNRAQGLAWAKQGDEIWFTATKSGFSRALYAVTLAGEERLVARVPGSLILHDLRADGAVLLTQDNIRREIFGLAPGESKERDLSWLDYSYPLDLSADGRTLLFAEGSSGRGMNTEMYLRATDGAPPVRLGQGGFAAKLSADGRSILNAAQSESGIRLEILPTGAGEVRSLPNPELELNGEIDWIPGERRIAFNARLPGRRLRTYAMDLPDGRATPITPEGVEFVSIAPDGRHFLALDHRDSSFDLYPLAEGAPRRLPWSYSPEFIGAKFRADGRSIIAARAKGGRALMEIWDLETGRSRPWKELGPSDPAGVLQLFPAGLTLDGRAYVYTTLRILSTLYRAEGLE